MTPTESPNRTPRWVGDSLAWPTPADCKAMTEQEAEQIIRRAIADAITAGLVIEYQTARRDRQVMIARKVSAVHPAVAAMIEQEQR